MEFAELITPDDPAFLDAGRRIHAVREDLRLAYPDVEGRGFRKWLAVSGALEYRDELGRFFPELPPEDIRRTGCGGAELHSHLYTSLEDFEVLYEACRLFGDRPFGELMSVFDFGCGCGRVMRWFEQALPGAAHGGCDVRRAGIDWCNEHLRGTYLHSAAQPPLEVPDASQDLVLALSLFSHFERASGDAWMAELARITRPGGHLLVTTHGLFSAWVLARSAEHQRAFHLDAQGAADLLRRLQREDFVFHRPPQHWLDGLDGPTADYGQAFLTEGFARQGWGGAVEVVGFVPAGLFLFQDLWVLRPR